ncbi:MAG: Tn3 family transposase [Pseudomonadota bacterium]|nr:Tn3 family transposase [Pseudomonadota bacterium]
MSTKDVADVREKFRGARLGAALQLVFIRVTGRSLDAVSGVPRVVLQSLCKSLGLKETAIASLRALYKRPATRFEHQRWARERCGFAPADETAFAELRNALSTLVGSAASVDDLVKQAELWLFGNKYLLPGDRTLRDIAREAFSAQERSALETVRRQIPKRELRAAITRVFSKRKGRVGGTVLEWLRTPPAKHGQPTLSVTTQKVTLLKALGVHQWDLSAIASARLQAYAQAVVGRPPFDTERLSEDTRDLEIACFLVATLLELTDATADLAGRRVCDFIRRAAGRVQEKQARSSIDLHKEREQIRAALYEEGRTAEQKIATLRALIPPESTGDCSRAALVRSALVEDGRNVTALLNAVSVLELRGDVNDRSMKQVKTLRELARRGATQLPSDFDVSMADPVWHELLRVPDRGKALAALRACAVTSVRKGLKGGRLWLAHSRTHRDREAMLIPPAEWQAKRQGLVSALSLTAEPKKFLERMHAKLDDCLAALAQAVGEGRVTIDAEGRLHLPALQAADIDAEATRSRDAMFDIIGPIQFGDMLVQVDARSNFSEAVLGHRAKSVQELVAAYGALLAHGTENDAKGVAAMVPGLEVSHITAAMRAMEAAGRLRRANEHILEFQQSFAIALSWGNGEKASADAMSVDASRHLYTARLDPRRKSPAMGVYTHYLDSYGLFYDQPVVLNERQAAAAVHGVEAYNAKCSEDRLRLSLLAVDTHGYTNAAMAVAKLLGFDLCVRLRNLAERMLHLPAGIALPDALARLKTGRVSERKIKNGWDELLRLVASIRGGRLTAKEALDKLGSAAKGDALHAATDELGKLLRTIFLCDYFTKPDFRRELHTLLNRGESAHQLQRAVYHGRIAPERGRRGDELRAISGAHALLTNVVIAWNTMKMQEVVDRWRAQRHPIRDDWLRRIGPVHFGHINFRGTIAFKVDEFIDALVQCSTPQRAGTTR